MGIQLEGSFRCGGVRFSAESHTPYPYQRCYCTICRKTAGGGGYAINLMADGASLKVRGRKWLGIYSAKLERDGRCRSSEEHTSELQSLMRISYAVFCLKNKTQRAARSAYTSCLASVPDP